LRYASGLARRISPRQIRKPVPITELYIDASSVAGEAIELRAKAVANNGCWSELEIEFTETSEHHFLFTATGLYSGDNVCPEMLVTKERVISFTPLSGGGYYFRANKLLIPILYDTLSVE
jgi:hypothetical protein